MKEWKEESIRGSLGFQGALSSQNSGQSPAAGLKGNLGSVLTPGLFDIGRVLGGGATPSICSDAGLALFGCDDIDSIKDVLKRTMTDVMDFDVGRLSWRPLDVDLEDTGSEFISDDLPESFDFSLKDRIVVTNDPLCLEGPVIECDDPLYQEGCKGTFRGKTPNGDPIVLNLRSSLSVPLEYRGERIGQLTLFSSSERRDANQHIGSLDPLWKALGHSLGRVLEIESLRKERDRSRDLLDGTDDILVVWRNKDSEWDINCNRKAEEMIDMQGVIPDMLDGPFFIPPGREWERAMNVWSSTFISGDPGQIDLQITDRNGCGRSFLCKFRAIREGDPEGPIVGVRMTGVEMETIDSGVRQLEATNRTYRLLLSILSHDLKNPLSAVRGYSELMDYVDEEKVKDYIRKITSLTRRMNDTITLANTFAQLQEGKITSDFGSIDVKAMVDNCLEMLYPKTESFTIIYEAGKGDFEIRGHRFLEQVVLNLLDNAMKYSGPGTKIRISLGADLSGIVLSVSDEGKGVPDNHKESIFERFTRVEDGSGTMGAGLGLAISKGICELHNGRIWVEDNPGGGSVFRVFLPWKQ